MDSELEKCKNSLAYFAENYVVDGNGEKIKWRDADLEMLRLLDEAQKNGGKLQRVWMRGKYQWMIVKN